MIPYINLRKFKVTSVTEAYELLGTRKQRHRNILQLMLLFIFSAVVLQCRDTARCIQQYTCTTQTAVKQAIRSLSALPCCWRKQSRSICEVTERASSCLFPVECKLTSAQTAWQTHVHTPQTSFSPGQTASSLLLNYKPHKDLDIFQAYKAYC